MVSLFKGAIAAMAGYWVGGGFTAGVSAGASVASAVGALALASAGVASGVATVSAVGSAGNSLGASTGSSAATAVGSSIFSAVGIVSGVATVAALGTGGDGVGAIAGAGTATALGAGTAETVGTSSGASAPAAVGDVVPVPWTPAVLSSSVLKVWHKASDTASITQTSGLVDQQNDKSGNSNHVTAATTRRPTTGTRTINSQNGLDYTGDDTMSKTSGTSLPDNDPGLTIAWVGKFDSASTAGWIAFATNSAASDFAWSFGRSGTNSFSIRGYHGTSGNQAAFNDNSSAVQMVSAIAHLTLRQIWQNGTSKATNTNTDTAKPAGRLYRGADNNPVTFFDGIDGELIIIEGTGQTLREKAEGYLAWEHGLVSDLDAGHPYKSAAPTV